MKTHILQRVLLLLSLSGASFTNLHADPGGDIPDMKRLTWAIAQLNMIMRSLPEENPGLREQAAQQMRELQELYQQQREQEEVRFLLGNELFDEIFN